MGKKQLVWNVYRFNANTQKIESWDVFQHGAFYDYLLKAKREYLKKDNFRFEDFMEQVKKELQYYYRSKSEWETIVAPWVGGDPVKHSIKIDVYEQIILNWEAFTEYLFHNYKLIKKK